MNFKIISIFQCLGIVKQKKWGKKDYSHHLCEMKVPEVFLNLSTCVNGYKMEIPIRIDGVSQSGVYTPKPCDRVSNEADKSLLH